KPRVGCPDSKLSFPVGSPTVLSPSLAPASGYPEGGVRGGSPLMTTATTLAQAPVAVRDLTVAYRETPVLWDVDLTVPEGRLVAIVGPNGAGKSTLIKAILDLVPRTSGTVSIYGKPYKDNRQLVGYVPQRGSVD